MNDTKNENAPDGVRGGTKADAMLKRSWFYRNEKTGKSVTLPYRVFFPEGYGTSDERYPILFYLHGAGECGEDNELQIRVLGGENRLISMALDYGKMVVLAPQCRPEPEYNWIPVGQKWDTGSRELTEEPTVSLAAASALLHEFLDSGHVDRNRVYIAGISMGGYGTWEMLAREPDVFAAAIPLCGAGIPSRAHLLTGIAIRAFHGEADGVVPSSGTHDMEDAIRAAGGTKMKATYYAGVGHDVWFSAFAEPGLFDWLTEQSG